MPSDAGPKLLRDWIARAARNPDKTWLVSVDQQRTISYGVLHETTRRIATLLRDRHIKANDRVALVADNSIEHLLTYFGVLAYGATICTIHVEMNRNQLQDIFARLKPRLLLYQEELGGLHPLLLSGRRLGDWRDSRSETFLGAVDLCEPCDAHAAADPDDDAVILFTSGTSSKPKGVVLNYRELLSNIAPTADGFGITASDHIYDFRSFNWASAQLLGALVPVERCATLIMTQKFSASRYFQHIRDHGVTVAAGNPTIINMLLNSEQSAHRDNVPDLRFITSSSAPLAVEDWKRFEQKFGIPIAQGYGQSESGWIAAIPGDQRRLGTAGRPLAYHELAIVGPNGQRLSPGEIGEVEIGGFDGHPYRYLAEDGSAAVASRSRIRTGDLGLLDRDGFLTLTGREKELIIRGGVNISPVEIDGVLMQRAEVIEAATIGVPDAIYGEEVVSYVVARPGAAVDAADLLRFCSTALPPFKAPKQIVLCASLPKNERGKLDRRALAAQWSQNTRA